MIRVENLHKSYRSNHVLNEINFEMKQPGVIAVLGPNGSGKTTLLKCILGMVLPDKGNIYFRDQSIKNQHLYRSEISYLSQIARFPENLTARELIQLMKEIKPGETREQIFIDFFNLEKEIDKKMGSLSGGTRQKVNITLALMHDDPVIILDEPSTGLDPLALKELKNFILTERAKGKLVIITTHILSLAEELSDDVLFLLEGQIYFNGSLTDLLASEDKNNLENAIAHILKITKEKSHV